LVEIIVKTDPFVTIHKLKWILQDTHIRVIVHCLQMFEDIENVLQSGCALSHIRPSTHNTHSLHPPHQSTMMAYQLTKHALCLVIRSEGWAPRKCAVPKRPPASSNYFTSFGQTASVLWHMSFGRKLQHRIFQGLCGTVTSESKVNYGQRSFPSIQSGESDNGKTAVRYIAHLVHGSTQSNMRSLHARLPSDTNVCSADQVLAS
jgi:hypothetical protein